MTAVYCHLPILGGGGFENPAPRQRLEVVNRFKLLQEPFLGVVQPREKNTRVVPSPKLKHGIAREDTTRTKKSKGTRMHV